MIDTRTFLKIPLNFNDKCKIYPPSIEEVFSEEKFSIYKNLLCITKEDIQDEFTEKKIEVDHFPLPLEYLLSTSQKSAQVEQILKQAFRFFLHEEVTFLYDVKVLVIGDLQEEIKKIKTVHDLKMIKENEFFDLQNLIRISLGEQPIERPVEDEDPRIARLKAKARYRDRIKAKKGVAGGLSFQTVLEALCCMGIGLTPLNIGQLSYASISPLVSRWQLKDKYETDIKSLLAGAKASKVHPIYWIKDE